MHVTLAATPLARLRGLIGRREPRPLLLVPAAAIHTWGMRFAIDAVFLDAELRVVKVARGLPPRRFAAARGARAVLELPAGAAAGMGEGERLALRRGSAGSAGRSGALTAEAQG